MDIPEPLLKDLKLYLYGRRAAHDAEAELLLKQLEEVICDGAPPALGLQNPKLIQASPPDQGLGC
ncbi:MAG: hypothetical protein EA366_02760 [Spirulina sp. DLM2.Bin59]|nr:MAG: hypothetical protein EA366_02760 [Spirulina sp. DLM2.Bin59]